MSFDWEGGEPYSAEDDCGAGFPLDAEINNVKRIKA